GGTLPEPVHAYSAALTVNTPYGAASYPFSLNISAWWHIEEIPKVPGHEDDEIELALYDYGPDGSLWGIHCYPGKYMYLIRWLGETFEYEQLPWDNVYDYITYLEVDREGRPAVLGELYTGILQWTPFFAIRTPEGWEKEDIAGTGQLLFDSANQPVIVYTLDSSAIWVARRTAPGEWERKCAVSDVSPVSYVTVALDDEDRVHMAFSSSDRMYYIRETADTWQLKTTADFYMDHDGALHKFHPLDLGLSAEGTVRALFAERFPVGAAYSDTIWFSDITEGLAWELVDSYVSEAGLLQGMEQLADIDGLVIATFRHPLESVQKIAWRLSGIWEVGTIAPDVYGGELKVIPPDGYAVVASGALAVYW
ncbi:hypothetical protein J7J84_07805, partial [bacterium]|nr:hypothetical protein [bacterium]